MAYVSAFLIPTITSRELAPWLRRGIKSTMCSAADAAACEVRMEFAVYTLGFSNRSWDETVHILQAHRIRRLIDIRTLPGSKHTPQFNLECLRDELPRVGIEYIHMKSLGGLRKPVKGSPLNAGWRNASFRAYADYMQTREFESAIGELIPLIREKTSVYCCTEAVFWRCHRQLVSDAMFVRGIQAGHIFTDSKVEAHKLTSFICAQGTTVTYPGLV
jgi:uncharacterized protein (DUF488 family)